MNKLPRSKDESYLKSSFQLNQILDKVLTEKNLNLEP